MSLKIITGNKRDGLAMYKINKILIILLLLLSSNNVISATYSAQLDINPVMMSDTFLLTYTAEGSVDDDPDFSPVRKDFELLGTQQSSNISMINGDFKRSKKWILTLRAKNTGTFRIPAINFGSETAPEVEIIVKDIPVSSSANPSQDYFVELETSKKSAYLQEQIIITARLLVAQNISSYQFDELRVDDTDTIIHSLGKDRQYKSYRGSKAFIIIEKQFAIFPQNSGVLTIQPFVSDIGILSNSSRGRFYDPFNSNTRTKRIQSNKLSINIKPIPSKYTNQNWLPTSSLKLIEEWPQNIKFKAGEPITRTITIMVDGLTSAQIPELEKSSITGLKQYPDKPVLQDKIGLKGINSIRKEKVAFIPTTAGTYTLPAIELPWWNTRTNKIDIAHISARTFKVSGSTQTTPQQTPTNLQPNISNNTSRNSIPKTPTNNSVNNENPFWMWASLGLFILWVSTVIVLISSKRKKSIRKDNKLSVEHSISTRLKYLKMSCSKNNAQETKTALLNWAKVLFANNDVNNLSDLADLLGEPISSKILELNSSLYSAKADSWKCEELYNLCKNFKVSDSTSVINKNHAELETLNK